MAQWQQLEEEKMGDFIESLKVGDMVIVSAFNRFLGEQTFSLEKVTKITPVKKNITLNNTISYSQHEASCHFLECNDNNMFALENNKRYFGIKKMLSNLKLKQSEAEFINELFLLLKKYNK